MVNKREKQVDVVVILKSRRCADILYVINNFIAILATNRIISYEVVFNYYFVIH